jgi:hypothetical protein
MNYLNEKINFKQIAPLIILMLILTIGLIYYSQNKSGNAADSANNTNGGEVTLNGSGNLQGNSIGNSGQGQNTTTVISDGTTYNAKITEIRLPVNKNFEDLSSKAKYTTLFSKEEIQNLIDDTQKKTEDAIKTLKSLKIDPKFNSANSLHLKSLELLLDSINSFEKARNSLDQTEAQKLMEQYAYDIDQSNSIIQKIQIPQ